MSTSEVDSLKIKSELIVQGQKYTFFSLKKATMALGIDLAKIPNVIKVLLENLLRNDDGKNITLESIKNLLNYASDQEQLGEILFYPARVLMQDFTGVPAIVDLAAMRDAMRDANQDPKEINPLIPVDLVIDHSVQVDKFGFADSYAKNIALEMQRNNERYEFLKWGQESFENFKVIPPGMGICHQVNLEYLASVVSNKKMPQQEIEMAFFDTLVGTDSHTTMVNGMSVLGWGVGGIEAESCMLGQPISMLIPKVVGFKLTGKLSPGITATDLVLTITEILRQKNVVGKFVEFYGPGVKTLSLFERATVANMAPEYGATCGYFPVDEEVIKYLDLTGRNRDRIALVEAYSKEQGVWQGDSENTIKYNELLELDISGIKPCLAGPKRPQDRIELSELKSKTERIGDKLQDGDIVISAITSCTNTSNPYVLVGAGLLAKKAIDLGLRTKPWVKTSLAPGSQVVTEYLQKSGLMHYLEQLGFYLVGYGCTTCIGNSGPLPIEVETAIKENNLAVSAILSGNRNFEGRIHPLVKDNYLASPILCVAFALVGQINFDILKGSLGVGKNGQAVYLKDIWPSDEEIKNVVNSVLNREMYIQKYSNIFEGDEVWKGIKITKTSCYSWQKSSTYIKKPPFFEKAKQNNSDIDNIEGARILAILGDSVTTDHISPAGNISATHSAGQYLISHGVEPKDFNSFGSRRGNDEVMVRGTFANTRIKNKLADGKEGGYTKHYGKKNAETLTTIYDAAMKYQDEGVPLVIFAGKEYGTGSSRDWAAKGTKLLGVKAVIAESFERIHRSNLIGMGVLPLQFIKTSLEEFRLNGTEVITLYGYNKVQPKGMIECKIKRGSKVIYDIQLLSRIDTEMELEYFLNNGILNHILNKFIR
jgi:aconitate hydratase